MKFDQLETIMHCCNSKILDGYREYVDILTQGKFVVNFG